MGIWWLLVLAAIWKASYGENVSRPQVPQNQTAQGNLNDGSNGTEDQQHSSEMKKRGAGLSSWYEKQAFGAQQMKKIPKFSSWGGKRDAGGNDVSDADRKCLNSKYQCLVPRIPKAYLDMLKLLYTENLGKDYWKEEEKRGKFSSWGGKRGDAVGAEQEKRKFSSWGGKRTIETPLGITEEDKRKFSSWGGKRNEMVEDKRARFSSWGGKRDQEESELFDEDKRAKFTRWGGKRINSGPAFDRKRAKFSSWGGKRSADDPEEKRTRFSSWGGKRSEEDNRGGEVFNGEAYNEDEEELDKRARFASWGGKRGSDLTVGSDKRAKFSSWGGKRSDEEAFYDPEDKRTRFSSWGGKRNEEGANGEFFQDDKRAKFSSWGGKRNDESGYDQNVLEDKRAKFSSWGGKRNYLNDDSTVQEGKRAKFSSWGGKRNDDSNYDPNILEDKRAKFSSWGGKRNDLNDDAPEKRTRFSSWGGKRSDEDMNDDQIEEDKRARFSSWGGKRDVGMYYDYEGLRGKRSRFNSWGGKRGTVVGGEKRRFSSWGGKRSGLLDALANYEAKRKFTSWGGKRDDQDPSGEEYVEPESTDEGSTPSELNDYSSNNTYGADDLNLFDIHEMNNICYQRDLSSGGEGSAKKRDPLLYNWPQLGSHFNMKSFKRKPVFSSWGGKRYSQDVEAPDPDKKLDEICWVFKKYLEKLHHEAEMKHLLAEDDKAFEKSPIPDKNRETEEFEKKLDPDSQVDSSENELDKRSHRYPPIGGKRRTPFSSWGGKRSFNDGDGTRKHSVKKRSIGGTSKKPSNVKEIFTNYRSLYSWNLKRSPISPNKNTINRFYSKSNLMKDGSWTAVLRPIRRGSDFYPWGGKRSS